MAITGSMMFGFFVVIIHAVVIDDELDVLQKRAWRNIGDDDDSEDVVTDPSVNELKMQAEFTPPSANDDGDNDIAQQLEEQLHDETIVYDDSSFDENVTDMLLLHGSGEEDNVTGSSNAVSLHQSGWILDIVEQFVSVVKHLDCGGSVDGWLTQTLSDPKTYFGPVMSGMGKGAQMAGKKLAARAFDNANEGVALYQNFSGGGSGCGNEESAAANYLPYVPTAPGPASQADENSCERWQRQGLCTDPNKARHCTLACSNRRRAPWKPDAGWCVDKRKPSQCGSWKNNCPRRRRWDKPLQGTIPQDGTGWACPVTCEICDGRTSFFEDYGHLWRAKHKCYREKGWRMVTEAECETYVQLMTKLNHSWLSEAYPQWHWARKRYSHAAFGMGCNTYHGWSDFRGEIKTRWMWNERNGDSGAWAGLTLCVPDTYLHRKACHTYPNYRRLTKQECFLYMWSSDHAKRWVELPSSHQHLAEPGCFKFISNTGEPMVWWNPTLKDTSKTARSHLLSVCAHDDLT